MDRIGELSSYEDEFGIHKKIVFQGDGMGVWKQDRTVQIPDLYARINSKL